MGIPSMLKQYGARRGGGGRGSSTETRKGLGRDRAAVSHMPSPSQALLGSSSNTTLITAAKKTTLLKDKRSLDSERKSRPQTV